MLPGYTKTIPAEARDFPEWHRGRETYAVWILPLEDNAVRETFEAAQEHLDGYLLEPYQRQPHITLFVCGFLVDCPHYNDDFTHEQLQAQFGALEQADLAPFEIEIGGLKSFASAPFLEIGDPENGIPRLREVLSHGAREFRTAPYTPHLTVGLYADAFSSERVMRRLAEFSRTPIRWAVNQVTLATYKSQEFAGRLSYRKNIRLREGHKL